MKIQFNAHVSHYGGVQKTANGKNYRELIVLPDDTQYYAVRFYKEHWAQIKQLKTAQKVTLTCQTQSARQYSNVAHKTINTILLIGKEIELYEDFTQSKNVSAKESRSTNLELAIPWGNPYYQKRGNSPEVARKSAG